MELLTAMHQTVHEKLVLLIELGLLLEWLRLWRVEIELRYLLLSSLRDLSQILRLLIRDRLELHVRIGGLQLIW